ncbi:MAG: PEP-CTERM sorting domain-containing protein [Gloeomargarita sp. SKYB31]|nr:PEP-CTERM sorting domain-containing protein [Gloeomargarita sp. SKYB31]
MQLQKLLVIASLWAVALLASLSAQNVTVTVTIFSDNGYALFYTDPASGNLVRAGFRGGYDQSAWRIPDTHTFSAPLNSYLYVIAHDQGIAAFMAAKVVFPNTTVYTGVGDDWEVNELYRTDLSSSFNEFQDTDPVCQPATVLDWLAQSNSWVQPAVGAEVGNATNDQRQAENDLFRPARYIWAPPGGGDYWDFTGYTDAGTALFRLKVVPEPASWLVLGVGLAGLAKLKRRKG